MRFKALKNLLIRTGLIVITVDGVYKGLHHPDGNTIKKFDNYRVNSVELNDANRIEIDLYIGRD